MVLFAEPPYFMTNEEWYYFDEKECRTRLTDAAPPEARESYEEYHKHLEEMTVRY